MHMHLPDRWILDRYMRVLHRVLCAARAHANHTHQAVLNRLTEGVELRRPNSYSADETEIQDYLKNIGRTIVETRYACNSFYDSEGRPYELIESRQPGAATALWPGCEAALSLLDAVDDNIPSLLMHWEQPFWCRPRDLYNGLRRHEEQYESGLARFTGFLHPIDTLAPSIWTYENHN